MEAETVRRIETAVDGAASAMFAAAVGGAAYVLLNGGASGAAVVAETAMAAAALLLGFGLLRRVGPRIPPAPVPIFDVRAIEPMPEAAPADEALLLDDVLAELGPDSRVVRLFDRAAMPSPGELKARIDRHLDGDRDADAPAGDASQALHDALAELRRSLR